jgi:cytochrome b pre-mRNA-processing protein 3
MFRKSITSLISSTCSTSGRRFNTITTSATTTISSHVSSLSPKISIDRFNARLDEEIRRHRNRKNTFLGNNNNNNNNSNNNNGETIYQTMTRKRPYHSSAKTENTNTNNINSNFTNKPKSLAIPFEETSEIFEVPEKRITKISIYTRLMMKLGGYDSNESVQNRASQRLFKAVIERCDEVKLYAVLGLEHSFRSEHAMFVLHVWLVLARLRREGDAGKSISQMFYDTFQEEVEKRVHREGVKVRVRSTLKELEQSFYGSALAYDRALSSGNDDFMKALRRNVFMNEGEEKNAKALERYCRREIACLHITDTEAVVSGRIRFSKID